jgi:hypothetical protein
VRRVAGPPTLIFLASVRCSSSSARRGRVVARSVWPAGSAHPQRKREHRKTVSLPSDACIFKDGPEGQRRNLAQFDGRGICYQHRVYKEGTMKRAVLCTAALVLMSSGAANARPTAHALKGTAGLQTGRQVKHHAAKRHYAYAGTRPLTHLPQSRMLGVQRWRERNRQPPYPYMQPNPTPRIKRGASRQTAAAGRSSGATPRGRPQAGRHFTKHVVSAAQSPNPTVRSLAAGLLPQ